MSHRIALVLLSAWCAMAALIAPAAAAPGDPYRIDVPAGWNLLADQSQRLGDILTAELASTPPVPGLTFTVQARNWRGPDAGLVVTWLSATTPAKDAPAAVRALLDHMHATPTHAALNEGDTRIVSWRDGATGDAAEGHLVWQHVANGTTTLSRALVYLTTTGQPTMVRADCIIGEVVDTSGDVSAQAAAAPSRVACDAVLASLALTGPADQRAPLAALPPAGTTQPGAGAATEPALDPGQLSQPPAKRSSDLPPAPSLRAPAPGSQGILAMQPAPPEKRKPNWLYLIGGALLVGGAYMVLRNRRSSEDSEDAEDSDNGNRDSAARAPDDDAADDAGNGAGPGSSAGNGSSGGRDRGRDADDEDPDRQ